MKVLLLAPLLDPEAIGEPTWCLALTRELIKHVDADILTQTPYDRSFKIAELFPNNRVYECPSWPTRRIHTRLDSLAKPNYFRFARFARKMLSRELDLSRYACAHQYGPLAPRYPSPLRSFDLPYVIGPLGGSLPTPPALKGDERQPWYYALRNFDGMRFARDPFLRATYANAASVVGVGSYVADLMKTIPLKRFDICPEVAVGAQAGEAEFESLLAAKTARPGPKRILSISRLIFSKAIGFGLEAMARVNRKDQDWRWDIISDGPERARLEQQSRDLGLADKVTFHGFMKREALDPFYDQADLFLHPSIREPSGAVVFEAMAKGLPMVVANYGGPGSHVTDAFGHRVDVDSQQGFIAGLADGVLDLLSDDEKRARFARAAFRTAREEHAIEKRARFFVGLYGQIARGVQIPAGAALQD